MTNQKFYAERQPWRNGVAIHLMSVSGGQCTVAQPVVMKATERGMQTDPFLRIDMDAAQHLMDELWNCGLRPTEGAGSAGSLAATERHLEDMRRLVFTNKETA